MQWRDFCCLLLMSSLVVNFNMIAHFYYLLFLIRYLFAYMGSFIGTVF